MVAAATYMSFSLLWLASVPERWSIPVAILLLLLSQCITLTHALVVWKPDLNIRIIRMGGYLFSFFMVLFWLILLRDSILALLFILNSPSLFPGIPATDLHRAAISVPFEIGMVAVGLATAAVGMFHALRVPPVIRVPIAIPLLPANLDGLRIVHLSDLHVGSTFTGAWLEAVVDKVNALAADIVCITGDLADGPPEQLRKDLHHLAKLQSRYGTFVCPGNHDYYSGLNAWACIWQSWGLDMLLNEHRALIMRGESVIVGGVTDRAALFHGLDMPDTRKAFLGCPEGFRILLSHRPEDAEQNAALGCNLQLSGHTHGGQFFFVFPLVSYMNKGFRSKLHRADGMPVYVCPGTGMWGYVPMRLGVAAEISLLELKREEHAK